ncbi:uncharacterized protein LAESUDRAFT_695224 [Laetiporus sulphureus 93-53]|uniref:EH domain-containing protein n=1 Tax=Laetiporus sulphureus 93-53 TaxID=1314785 RepID=A0A165FYH6_9APHY|nr:uncharacterized protein LAESUDRAFT_695224 [Laetiporus sulphureus 93-53]KZT09583.1 hypothetical protein LAESUDRAFT_695224 [Laetiporus sulphureus 93-53]
MNGKAGMPIAIASRPPPRHVSDAARSPGPLINLEASPPTASMRPIPPLPPRKPSYASLKSVTTSESASSSMARSPTAPSPPKLPPRDQLSVDNARSPSARCGGQGQGHVSGSSISSFHSVSLSDGANDPPSAQHLGASPSSSTSLTESFENLSATSSISPARPSPAHDWETYMSLSRPSSEPPKLPQRLKRKPPPSETSLSRPTGTPKPSPPPPPVHPPIRSRAPPSRTSSTSTAVSEQSSISMLTASSATSHTPSINSSYVTIKPTPTTTPKSTPVPVPAQLSRPTPVPPAARLRYEALFDRNILAQRAVSRENTKSPPPGVAHTRKAAGWRGLSVDLLTNPDLSTAEKDHGVSEVGSDEWLAGETVRRIWSLSRLQKERLRTIWADCDPSGTGTLDREAFVKGMWRIDEELRHAHLRMGRYGNRALTRHGSAPNSRALNLFGTEGLSRTGSGSKLILR